MTARVHTPVLADSSIDWLITDPDGIYVDVTFGTGGHSRKILQRLSPSGRLLAMDVDPQAIPFLPCEDPRFHFVRHNFRYLMFFLEYLGWVPVQGILADLGVSSLQLEDPGKGFTYRVPAPLDMRMDPDLPSTAMDLLRHASEEHLADIFRQYGDIENARVLARKIVKARRLQPILTSSDLIQVVQDEILGNPRRYLARLFQALRIAVNQELKSLEQLLEQAERVLAPGGRLVILTYHSLEDRMVKIWGRRSSVLRELPESPLAPSPEEIRRNPRARSAHLRILEKWSNPSEK